ncbi:MFS transporter [Micromonospora sp. HM5-17]|jgi:Na+/melibiose symporter-like transporter|uniref:MFS transporter n=1 Tax=Micromonospora sp. HM5-17 TaxID=2487710 RepID=UPI000F48EE00|nr:MFS transporter [Micromonospora sp. HM5-17]ROT32218.1 MFS transporter [Micromonospora sp. HM5-17]
MRTVLRRPDFRLLFAGLVFSMTAESIMALALAVWVKDLTGSDGMAGATVFAMIAPMVFAPVVGWVADRFRRRPFFVAANIGTALVLTPLFLVRERDDVWIIYVVGSLYGLAYVALNAALNGLLKQIMPEALMAEANGALQTVKQGLRLVGPLLGAALYSGAGGWTLALVGMVGFLTAATAVSGLPVEEARPQPARLRWIAEVGAGLRHMTHEPALRRAVLGVALAVLVMGFSESLIFAYVDQGLGREPAFVGVLVTVQGVGGLLGGLLSPVVVRRFGEVAALAVGVTVFASGALLLVYPTLWLAFVALVLLGFNLPIALVGMATLIQRRTPGFLLGRVGAASAALISGPSAVSIGTGALLVGLVDYRLLFVVMTVVMMAAAGYLWTGRRLSPPAVDRPRALTVAARVRGD